MSNFKNTLVKRVQEYKIKTSMNDLDDNHAIAALHLRNKFKCDDSAAFDQTSHGSNDHGVDAWYFSEAENCLYIYQSKFSEDFKYICEGLKDFIKSLHWLESLVVNKEVLNKKMNHSLEGLFELLCKMDGRLSNIKFAIISCLDETDADFSKERDLLEKHITQSKLNKLLNSRGGGIEIIIEKYNCSKIIISGQKKYNVSKILNTTVELPSKENEVKTSLGLAYIPLFNLVKLYREMGDRLFNKNVRLTLIPFKDSKMRVVNPMEKTLREICSGKLPAEIFTFFHIGVTLSTKSELHKKDCDYELEDPSIINGCQTVTIAERFLRSLELEKKVNDIEVFKKIRVMAKVVVGASDGDLREITNCNNRQNPIEDWQLYCNDEIHLLIEEKFKSLGVFYERQKGKFELIKNDLDVIREYPNTKMNFVRIDEFAQVIAVCRNMTQLAAKPADIFSNTEVHNSIFNEVLLQNSSNFVYALNAFRALKSSLVKYQRENEDYQVTIFKKPIIRMHLFYIGILYMFSKIDNIEANAIDQLQKKALPNLNDEAVAYYRKVMRKTKTYFMQFEKENKEVSPKARDKFFKDLLIEIKLKDKTYL